MAMGITRFKCIVGCFESEKEWGGGGGGARRCERRLIYIDGRHEPQSRSKPPPQFAKLLNLMN